MPPRHPVEIFRTRNPLSADLPEVLNLDEGGKNVREVVDAALLLQTEAQIRGAGESIRQNQLERLTSWCGTCSGCDLAGLCRDRTAWVA